MELLYMLAGAALFAGGFFCARILMKKDVQPIAQLDEPQEPTPEEKERARQLAKQWENWISFDGRPRE